MVSTVIFDLDVHVTRIVLNWCVLVEWMNWWCSKWLAVDGFDI